MAVKRKIPEAQPSCADVFYAFKIGSLPTGAGPLDLYVGMRDGWMAPPVSNVTAAQAMRQLAEYGEGYELQCEPRLAKAGKRCGFEPAEAPEWAATVRCGLSLCMAPGPSMGPDCMLPAAELAKASAKFLKGAPWQYWHSDLPMKFEASGLVERAFEGCIMGSGGSEYGLALYEERSAMEKLVKLHKAGKQKQAANEMHRHHVRCGARVCARGSPRGDWGFDPAGTNASRTREDGPAHGRRDSDAGGGTGGCVRAHAFDPRRHRWGQRWTRERHREGYGTQRG